MQLTGVHHVTAITADAPGNYAFYTEVMGLRLVKKTVNQDDTSAYHLFFADGIASPGTDLTFFNWPARRETRGTNAVVRSSFRVTGVDTLAWWAAWFDAHEVHHDGPSTRDGRAIVDFEDPEGQRLSLVDDGGAGEAHPWVRSSIAANRQIRGLGYPTLSVASLGPTDNVLRNVLNMRMARTYNEGAAGTTVHVYEMAEGGQPDREVHVRVEPHLPIAGQGAGAVHHIAFRTPDEEGYRAWTDRLGHTRLPSSGPVDRYYFQSLYMREPNGILIEIATDGPGFATDEPMATLGERLSLPPFLEPRRAAIEAGLKPLQTTLPAA